MALEVTNYVEALRQNGDLFASAVGSQPADAAVPSCPDWTVRDLARHTGAVHRWATGYVTGQRREPTAIDAVATWPDDTDLAAWLVEGVDGLVAGIEQADPDLECFTFLPAPSPLTFWARRQAHETTIHRVDAEQSGGSVTMIPTELAADGLDELLAGFARRPGKLDRSQPQVLHLHADDAATDWTITFAPGGGTTSDRPPTADADCRVGGTAAELYLLMWNRQGLDGLAVTGDPVVITTWREDVRVR